MQHSPPSTYILRNLFDVEVPSRISWYPQTIGWKVLALMMFIFLCFWLYRKVRFWWDNRYRAEAITAISKLDFLDPQYPSQLFKIMKTVAIHIYPKSSSQFGEDFLATLDAHAENKVFVHSYVAQQWLESAVNPNSELSQEDRLELKKLCEDWLNHHKAKSLVEMVHAKKGTL
ncbi:DUF4381 domain-containing protein [Vibrio lamellibrachiae]|uniref:DUF4381 domain-containing protein n=1 Tax=Vibrio lamellibrachiae TaxID=2910253 RepID=UPI003D0BF8DD